MKHSRNHQQEELADDAQSLMAATAEFAGEQIDAARKRLAAAIERTREFAGDVQDKAIAGAKATDAAVHKHPYQAIAIGFGVGALVGYLLARRRN